MTTLLTDNLPLLAGAPNGIKKLRELILELAVRGKLVPQDPNDEPANELLKRIAEEKAQLVAEGKIKKQKPLAEISEEDNPFELPRKWEWVRLGEIAEIIRGVTYNKSDASDAALPEYAPLLRGNNINRILNFDRPVFVPKKLISEQQYIRVGDIVIAMSSGSADLVGKAAQATASFDGAFGAFCGVVRSRTSGLFELFGLFFQTPLYRSRAAGHGKGIGINNLQKSVLETLEIPIPPLAEQHRIVAKVDELMALCDRLETQQADAESAHAKLVQALLDSLTQARDAVDFAQSWQRLTAYFHTLFTTESSIDALKRTLLQLAVMGKLVPQDPSDESAEKLLKRISDHRSKYREKKQKSLSDISEVAKPFELPSQWAWATLPAIGELARGKSRHRPRNDSSLYAGGNVPLIQTGDVARANGVVKTHSAMYNAKGVEQSRLWPAGTMCITIAANIADSALLGFDACFPDSVVGFIPDLPELDVRYFEFFLRTAKTHLEAFAPSTAQKNINLEILGLLSVPLPPAKEVHRIVAKVDQLMALCDQLKARLTHARQLNEQLASTLVEQAVA